MMCDYREPSLTEVMDEPIIRAMMERDAVERFELLELLERVRANFDVSEPECLAH